MNQIHQNNSSNLSKRFKIRLTFIAIFIGVMIAGFWDYQLVDGFGSEIVAGNMVGDTSELAGAFLEKGLSFGILFGFAAGLAATFTACNCVIFAMLPGLACSTDKSSTRKNALISLGVFSLGVLFVTAFYGLYTGFMSSSDINLYNERGVRLSQAYIIFTALGLLMLSWGLISFGFFNRIISKLPLKLRTFLSMPLTKAGVMGIMVGLFSVGRPFPVFRDFLTYAVSADNPLYGALVMSVQGIGQILIMVVLFVVVIALFGKKLAMWSQNKPHQAVVLSAFSLLIGGAYFIFYWGFAVPYGIGRWGEWFGWY
ncbi:hypothetical protein [Cytobacillus firmus]|uniref:hypothetical protein n=1 Tax=Cytobacillus firmus TaxID=1399 RepID=UPI003002721E